MCVGFHAGFGGVINGLDFLSCAHDGAAGSGRGVCAAGLTTLEGF